MHYPEPSTGSDRGKYTYGGDLCQGNARNKQRYVSVYGNIFVILIVLHNLRYSTRSERKKQIAYAFNHTSR